MFFSYCVHAFLETNLSWEWYRNAHDSWPKRIGFLYFPPLDHTAILLPGSVCSPLTYDCSFRPSETGLSKLDDINLNIKTLWNTSFPNALRKQCEQMKQPYLWRQWYSWRDGQHEFQRCGWCSKLCWPVGKYCQDSFLVLEKKFTQRGGYSGWDACCPMMLLMAFKTCTIERMYQIMWKMSINDQHHLVRIPFFFEPLIYRSNVPPRVTEI